MMTWTTPSNTTARAAREQHMRPRLMAISLIALLAYSAAASQAQPTTAFTYQGQLKSAGAPVNGTVDFRFRLYDAPTPPGNQVGPQVELSSVQLANGLFAVPLDFTADAYGANQPRWLEVDLRSPAGNGAFTTLEPRQPLTPTPFALNTRGIDVDAAGNVAVGPIVVSSFRLPSGAAPGSVLTSDNLGIGTWAPASCVSLPCSASTNVGGCAFSITNAGLGNAVCGISTAATGAANGVYGRCATVGDNFALPGSAGVFGESTAATGYSFGVQGVSASSSGRGVFGWATSPTGLTHGVLGQNNSAAGIGVRGEATAATGITYGGYFNCNSTTGRGLFSRATATTGSTYGVFAENYSPNGLAVYGKNLGTTGSACGVYGESVISTSGQGVFGLASAASGNTYGVYGAASSASGTGVYGSAVTGVQGVSTSPNGNGVSGYASGGSDAWGVAGETATGQAVIGRAGTALPGGGFAPGTGVLGYSNVASGFGMWGQVISGTATGIVGTNTANSGPGIGIHGYTSSNTGVAIQGTAVAPAGLAIGVVGEAFSTSGWGVFGNATATSGNTNGVWGQTASPNGVGVLGTNLASTGSGPGVLGITNSGTGVGVSGASYLPSGATTGVYGESNSSTGTGVRGNALAATGLTYGVYGQSSSTGGVGVYGYSPFSTGTIGVSDGASGIGVYGGADNPSGTGYAIYGSAASASAFGGYFNGNVHVTGTLTKGGGTFLIDHPLDPANKYLAHSFVESPDMMNIYNGEVTTDGEGHASVAMPDWFEALNRDFRYQLTVIDDQNGDDFVQAKVIQRIKGNQFAIRTSRPNVTVSWQVTGIRHDAFADAHRIRVEEDKPHREQGLYLYPQELGQPMERGIDYQREQRRGPTHDAVPTQRCVE